MSSTTADVEELMSESQAPVPSKDDQITPKEVEAEFGYKQDTQAGWRRRGQVSYWKRGGPRGFVILSRREITAFIAGLEALRPGRVLPSYESRDTSESNESS